MRAVFTHLNPEPSLCFIAEDRVVELNTLSAKPNLYAQDGASPTACELLKGESRENSGIFIAYFSFTRNSFVTKRDLILYNTGSMESVDQLTLNARGIPIVTAENLAGITKFYAGDPMIFPLATNMFSIGVLNYTIAGGTAPKIQFDSRQQLWLHDALVGEGFDYGFFPLYGESTFLSESWRSSTPLRRITTTKWSTFTEITSFDHIIIPYENVDTGLLQIVLVDIRSPEKGGYMGRRSPIVLDNDISGQVADDLLLLGTIEDYAVARRHSDTEPDQLLLLSQILSTSGARELTPGYYISRWRIQVEPESGNSATDDLFMELERFATWETSAESPWTTTQDDFLVGSSSARSGVTLSNSTSELSARLIGGTLTFWWKVSSQVNSDFLEVHLNGELQARISGERGWERVEIDLPVGTSIWGTPIVSTVEWVYRKDGSATEGTDTGWIDAITYTPFDGKPILDFYENSTLKSTASSRTFDNFGAAVAVEEHVAFIGAPQDDEGPVGNGGAVYVFERDGAYWTSPERIAPPSPDQNGMFGSSIDIYADTLVVGAPLEYETYRDSGAVYVFGRNPQGWEFRQKLIPLDPWPSKRFGQSVSVYKNVIAVGAPGGSSADDSGNLYVFELNPDDVWVEEARLEEGGELGQSVEVYSQREILSGAPNARVEGKTSGTVVQYLKADLGSGYKWQAIGYIDPSTGAASGDEFGHSLDYGDGYLLVGAPGSDADGPNSGAVYVYRNPEDTITFEYLQSIHPRAPQDKSGFGADLSFDSARGMVVVGAPGQLSGSAGPGQVYSFVQAGDDFVQREAFSGRVSENNDRFGESVAFQDGVLLVGAPGIDYGGEEDAGLGFLFEEDMPLSTGLNNRSLRWDTDGDQDWYTVRDNTAIDGFSARSGNLQDSQESTLATIVMGPGEVRFRWKTSSERDYDVLEFEVDGTEEASISDQSEWSTYSIDLGFGFHQLRWSYTKDSSFSFGADLAQVDQVNFLPDAPAPGVLIGSGVAGFIQGVALQLEMAGSELAATVSIGELSGATCFPTLIAGQPNCDKDLFLVLSSEPLDLGLGDVVPNENCRISPCRRHQFRSKARIRYPVEDMGPGEFRTIRFTENVVMPSGPEADLAQGEYFVYLYYGGTPATDASDAWEIQDLVVFGEKFRISGGLDINGDDIINAVDVQLVINSALGLDIGDMNGDVNLDGAVNATDVQLVINAALGITPE